MNNINDIFWRASIEDIKKGYTYDKGSNSYICLLCGEAFLKGRIYSVGELLFDAEGAASEHIDKNHGSVFEYIINLNRKYTGLTDIQKEILLYFYQGLNDKEIVEKQGGGSTSTIRNHRFKLKEKEKQSKIFLVLMELLEKQGNKEKEEKFISIHKGATMVDDRYAITEQEREKVLKTYIKDDVITTFPSKEKRKIIILQYIVSKFKTNKKYGEKEVNELIKRIYDDFVTVRRYLIEYGFMERTPDCREYWVKN